MAVVGALLNNMVRKRSGTIRRRQSVAGEAQLKTLKRLVRRARKTQFGEAYGFGNILASNDPVKAFQQQVPVFNYEKLYAEWWHKLLSGEQRDICWPGKVRYFGLTSGTSNDSSKRVPITRDMIRAIRRVGIRQLLALADHELPHGFYEKSALMLGGSTSLTRMDTYFEGDLSGILAGRLPFWFNAFYKPGRPIARERDWTTKIDKMVEQAPNWDIGGISGVPAWVQILIEKIIKRYNLENIHDIWPNFRVFAHGGVSFEPYRNSFNKLLGKEVIFLETYLASEGFLAFQQGKDMDMQLVLDNGVFFEFIPFDESNFGSDGCPVSNPEVLSINEVEEGRDYALLISTCAGTWRYLIGDTIRFTDKSTSRIVITGRTKHFLSLCGEHLSVDNMIRGVQIVSADLDLDVREFTVAGIPYQGLFAHKWFLGTDRTDVSVGEVTQRLDQALKDLNDDYCVERKAALKEVFVELLPYQAFYDYLKFKGKEGGQHKFPKVLNGREREWESFLTGWKKENN